MDSDSESPKLEADRQYLVESSTIRASFLTMVILGTILLIGLLLAASWGKTGRYVNPDRSQYQDNLARAAEFLNSTGPAENVDGDRVAIPIENTIYAVVDRGLSKISRALRN